MTLRKVIEVWVHDGTAFRRAGAGGAPGPSPFAPNPPTNLDCVPSTFSLLLSWDPPASTPEVIDFYEVSVNGSLAASPGGTTQNLAGLIAGASYTCMVRAVGENGIPSAWTPAEVFSTNPVVPPPSSSVKWGYAGQASSATEYARVKANIGAPKSLRWYRSDGQSFTWATGHADFATLPQWCSVKPDVATAATGAYDSQWRAFVQAASPTVWSAGTSIHEFDVKGTNVAQWVAMTLRFGAIAKEVANPNFHFLVCQGGAPTTPILAQQYADAIDAANGWDVIDGWTADPYASGQFGSELSLRRTYDGGRSAMFKYLVTMANSHLPPNMPLGIGEIGNAVWTDASAVTQTTVTTDAQRADWYRGAMSVAREDPRFAGMPFDIFLKGGIRFWSAAAPTVIVSPLAADVWRNALLEV